MKKLFAFAVACCVLSTCPPHAAQAAEAADTYCQDTGDCLTITNNCSASVHVGLTSGSHTLGATLAGGESTQLNTARGHIYAASMHNASFPLLQYGFKFSIAHNDTVTISNDFLGCKFD